MSRFKITLEGTAFVKGSLEVEAESSQEAIDKAALLVGDVVWEYDGLQEVTETDIVEVAA